MRRTTKTTTRKWQPLLLACCLLLSITEAAAQHRCDSIQLLFPDSATTVHPASSLTQRALDSIAASLKLPPNIGRKITLSAPSLPVQPTDARQDSVRRLRLESVALFLSGCGVADSLIIFQSDTCRVSTISDSLKVATPDATVVPGDSAATTDTVLGAVSAGDASPYIYSDSIAVAAHASSADGGALAAVDSVHSVWLHIDGGQWLGTGDFDVYRRPVASMSPADTLSADSVGALPQKAAIPQKNAPVLIRNSNQSPPTSSPKHSLVSTTSFSKKTLTSQASSSKHAPAPLSEPKSQPADMEQIESLKSLVSRQHDTISQLRRQLAEALQQGSQSLQQTTDGVPMFWLWVLLLLVALLLVAFLFKRRQYAKAADRLNDQELRVNTLSMELSRQREELGKIKAVYSLSADGDTVKNVVVGGGKNIPTNASALDPSAVPQKPHPVQVPSDTFENMYRGKALYASLVSGSAERIDHWGRDEITSLVEYYRLQKRDFVESMENDYNALSRNHKLFLILEDMGKTDAEIQKLLNITQTTIRSLRFRIRAKRKTNGSADNSDDSRQLNLFF